MRIISLRFGLWGIVLLASLHACQTPIMSEETGATVSPAPVSPDVGADIPAEPSESSPPEEVQLPIVLEPLLPPLNWIDIASLRSILTEQTESWFGLAGLGKLSEPPPVPETLPAYRQSWSEVNPAIAPFLGLWHDDQDAQNRYHISIFPSPTPGSACVLEFKPEWSLKLVDESGQPTGYKDVISEQILSFSVATIQGAQLRSSQVRMTTRAMKMDEYTLNQPYSVELNSVIDDDGTIRVLAAADLPTLPPDLPETLQQEVRQALANQDCATSFSTDGT